MDAALERLLNNIHDDVKEIKRDVKAQNNRIRKVEINQAKIFSGIAVIAIIVPIMIKLLF